MKNYFLRSLRSFVLLVLLPACNLLSSFFGAHPGFICDISPRILDHPVAEQMVAPAGEYPIWFVTFASIPMSELTRSVPPYDGGTIRKSFVVVSTDFEGDAVITGRQIDGDGVVLFPQGEVHEIPNEDGTAIFDFREGDVSEEKNYPNAQDSTFGTNAPGYAHHPISAYYPTPGCYELSGTFGGYTTHIIVEVRDE